MKRGWKHLRILFHHGDRNCKKELYNMVYLGLDVGSVSTNLVLLDTDGSVVFNCYLKTAGNPVRAIQTALNTCADRGISNGQVIGCGATGSGRKLAGVITGCDLVKNEISAHACAAVHLMPDIRTVIEIGGQDSKIILLENSIVRDFAMNTVCAAGTGAFLEAQAARLGITIEEFGKLAVQSCTPVSIAGRCTVFAESDIIHKQQTGYALEDILNGLCHALVRNYLTNVAQGKKIVPPVLFQGGVSENQGIRRALSAALECTITVPRYNTVMGALGMCLLLQKLHQHGRLPPTGFRGFHTAHEAIRTTAFDCPDCDNHCEILTAEINGVHAAVWNDRCGKWSGNN
jgi:predicted CoA-substrate-specific enzyme activase